MRSLSTLKYCGVRFLYIVSSLSLLVKVGVFHASKSNSCQLSLAPAYSCRWLILRSPDSAAQTVILCVIGKGGSNEPRSAELSRLRVSRASSPTTHISFLPSDRSSLFVKPFLFVTCRRQTNRLFSPVLARKAFNPIQFTFPHRLPFPFFDTPRSEFPSPSTLNNRRSFHGFSPSWTPRLNRRPATPLR